MTNDPKAPERIWAVKEPDWHDGNGEPFLGGTWDAGHLKEGASYIRHDLHQARIKGIYEDAQSGCQAALEADRNRVREEALRNVLGKEDGCGFVSREDILALIEGDTDD